ncbi:MAG: CHAT domain-containing protein [Caldilineaceae bacterium]
MDYLNFDLLILRNGNQYMVRASCFPVGESQHIFNLPSDFAELQSFSPLSDDKRRVRSFGEKLYRAVFAESVHACLERSVDKAREFNQMLRIRLRLDPQAPELAALPWEYLYAPEKRNYLALDRHISFVRYIELPQAPATLTIDSLPLCILAVAAMPKDLPTLAVEQEWDDLQKTVAQANKKQVKLERLDAPTWPALQQHLQQHQVHLLHFIGHGYFDEDDQQGMLLFEDSAGKGEPVAADELALALQSPHLRLVVLNTCESAKGSHTDYFAGLAQTLVSRGIPAVVAMQFSVYDTTAVKFAQPFYTAILAGESIDRALTATRFTIYERNMESSWAAPVFFSRSSDNQLIDPLDLLPDECPYRGLAYFDEKNAALYFGREAMVKELLEKLERCNFVLIVGASGSGKSSLVRAGLCAAVSSQQPWSTEIIWTCKVLRAADLLKSNESSLQQLLKKRLAQAGLLLIVDQLEELFTHGHDEAIQRSFLHALLDAADTGQVKVVCTLRADFYGHLLVDEKVRQHLENHLINLGPLGRPDRQAAIEKPALLRKHSFEPGLVERILTDLAEASGELPLLQFTLTKLWNAREKGVLTHLAYEKTGGVKRAIAQYAEATYQRDFSDAEKSRLQQIFVQMVQPMGAIQDTRRRVQRSEVSAEDWKLICQLTDEPHRLLVIGGAENRSAVPVTAEWAELVHEALIREWKDLQLWLARDREFRVWQEQLRVDLQRWQNNARDNEALLQGLALSDAEKWYPRDKGKLHAAEQAFIQASIDWRKQQMREKEAAKEQQQRLRREKAEQAIHLHAEQTQRAYQRQLLFGALGAGIGYGLAFSYLYITFETGPFFQQALSPDRLQEALIVFFNSFSAGALLGGGVGWVLWRNATNNTGTSDRFQPLLLLGGSSMAIGGLSYLGAGNAFANFTMGNVLGLLCVGALLGSGLVLSTNLLSKPYQRFLVIFGLGMVAMGFVSRIGLMIDLSSALLAGMLLGGSIGFFFSVGTVSPTIKDATP